MEGQYTGGLINPRPRHVKCRAGYSNTVGHASLASKDGAFIKKEGQSIFYAALFRGKEGVATGIRITGSASYVPGAGVY